MNPLDEIKPYIVTYLHEHRVKMFKEDFEKRNSRQPTSSELNAFIAVVIATGNINKEADEIGKELIKEIIKQNRLKNIFINSSFTLPLCGVLGAFLIVLLSNHVPKPLQSGWPHITTLLTTVVLLIAAVVMTVINFLKKDK